jgi:glycosyltransferase involved in cell wall biosynthesis
MAVYDRDAPEALRLALEASGPGQSLPPDRFLIVFDGPVPEMLRQTVTDFSTRSGIPVERLQLSENKGLSSALKAGVEVLRGTCDYIIRTDADDISRPDRNFDQLAFMQAHPEVGVASSQVVIFEDTPDNVTGKRFLPSGEDLTAFARSRTPINHSASIFRTSALEGVNYPETRLPFEDWWISLRLLKAGWKISAIDKVHLDFRGGADMIARRRGLRYARQEISYFHQIHTEGLMPTGLVASNLARRLALRMLPTPAMKALYALKMHR